MENEQEFLGRIKQLELELEGKKHEKEVIEEDKEKIVDKTVNNDYQLLVDRYDGKIAELKADIKELQETIKNSTPVVINESKSFWDTLFEIDD